MIFFKQKQASKDFTFESLAITRRQQFFDIIKNNFSTLLLVGFWLLVFFIPLFIMLILKDTYLFMIQNSGQFSSDEIVSATRMVKLLYGGISIVGIIIFMIGLSGLIKILRRLIWEEPLFFKYDLLSGIKENGFHFALIGLIAGLFNFGQVAIELFYSSGIGNLFISLPAGINFVIVYPILISFAYITSTYKNPFFKNLKIALALTAKAFLYCLIPSLVIYLACYLKFIPIIVVKFIILAVFIFVAAPLIFLGISESETKAMETRINIKYYPEYYRKGLYSPKEEDTSK